MLDRATHQHQRAAALVEVLLLGLGCRFVLGKLCRLLEEWGMAASEPVKRAELASRIEDMIGIAGMTQQQIWQTAATSGAYSMDLNFDQEIRVPLDGALHSTEQRFLGSAFGHNCRVGTGFWMASGRMIPNGYFVIRDPDAVLSRIEPGLEGGNPLSVQGRHLVPLGSPEAPESSAASPSGSDVVGAALPSDDVDEPR